MNFGGWFPLDDASASAPECPGLFQARADALVSYPRGRSAMVLYARCRPDETLRRYVTGRGASVVRRASAAGACFIRFGLSTAPDVDFARLMRRFEHRFGSHPTANVETADESAKGGSRDG